MLLRWSWPFLSSGVQLTQILYIAYSNRCGTEGTFCAKKLVAIGTRILLKTIKDVQNIKPVPVGEANPGEGTQNRVARDNPSRETGKFEGGLKTCRASEGTGITLRELKIHMNTN